MRRVQVDPFVMMEYIAMERKDYDSKPENIASFSENEAHRPTTKNIQTKIGKTTEFITAADRFALLPEEELQQLIASNVMRRVQVDPFVMMEYIAMERKDYDSKTDPTHNSELRVLSTRDKVGKSTSFVTAADRFALLPEEEQNKIKEWYAENQPTQKQLTEKIAETKFIRYA